jgi:hypothetical protein
MAYKIFSVWPGRRRRASATSGNNKKYRPKENENLSTEFAVHHPEKASKGVGD